jgi:hypothetical protein
VLEIYLSNLGYKYNIQVKIEFYKVINCSMPQLYNSHLLYKIMLLKGNEKTSISDKYIRM